ncbi:cystatin-B-like [Ornithodoros turicata]
MPGTVGGLSQDIKQADDDVRSICEKVRPEVESRAGKAFSQFTPLHYKTQLVNGVNYFVKVQIGESEYIHVRAHKSFQGEVTLWGHQENKSLQDELVHFQ